MPPPFFRSNRYSHHGANQCKSALPHKLEPTRLNTGITLIGKRAHLPDNLKVGRNCKIGTDLRPEDFSTDMLASGETVEDRTFAHGWERELARRLSIGP